MSSTTAKGVPVPDNSDTFDIHAHLQAIADWVNAHPGTSSYTTSQRDVLVGADIWPGRVIFNITTGQLEQNKTGTAGAGNWSPVTPADLAAGTPSMRTLGTGAQQATAGNDARLSNSRTPTGTAGGKLSGTYPDPGIAAGAVGTTEVAAANKDGAAGTPSMRTLGTGAQQATAGNDARLSNSRTPTGTAGGDLAGIYPNPTIKVGAVDTAEVGAGIIPSGTTVGGTTGTAATTTPALRALGTAADTAAAGNDARLSNSRTPTGAAGGDLSGTYPNPGIAAGAVGTTEVAAANKDGAAGTPSMRTLGTGAQQAAAGNHTHTDKAPLASPAFTGAPTAPTPATTDNDISLATTAFVKAAILAAHPVGSIYMSATATNPSTFLGGTWAAWGSGRVPVGIDTSQTEFSTVEKTGGEKTHVLTVAEMPLHNHSTNEYDSISESRGYGLVNGGGFLDRAMVKSAAYYAGFNTGAAGGSEAHNNLQPYITCYMWKRTA